jgi:hypothetical protein
MLADFATHVIGAKSRTRRTAIAAQERDDPDIVRVEKQRVPVGWRLGRDIRRDDPPAPPRLSMIMAWPRLPPIACTSTRAAKSFPPPGSAVIRRIAGADSPVRTPALPRRSCPAKRDPKATARILQSGQSCLKVASHLSKTLR